MEKAERRHRRILSLLRPIVTLYMRCTVNYQPQAKETLKGPFLVIANHVTDCDQFVVSFGFSEYIYYVIGEHTFRSGWLSRALRYIADPIPRFKATAAISTVREIMRRLRRGQSVCLFAEGTRSHNGLLNPIPVGTGNLVRKMNCTLVTYRIEGGYLTQPRWAEHGRKGWLSGHCVGIYPPEQLKQMQAEEINALIARDIGEDAYAENAQRRIAYRGKKLAEGLEFELVMCPKCGQMHTIHTQDDRFFCACGLQGRYDEYGLLHGEGFSFETVTQWDLWQQEQIASLPTWEEERTLCEDSAQNLTQVFPDHSEKVLDTGALRLTNRALYVGSYRFALEDLDIVDLFRHGYLLLNTKEKQYLEIKGGAKYPGYLYVLLIQRYRREN